SADEDTDRKRGDRNQNHVRKASRHGDVRVGERTRSLPPDLEWPPDRRRSQGKLLSRSLSGPAPIMSRSCYLNRASTERDPSRFLSECADLPLVASAKNASRRSLDQPAFFSTRWTLARIAKTLPSVPVRRMRGRDSVGWSGTDASGPHMGDR